MKPQNPSTEAPTDIERRARVKLYELTGFGAFAPITTAFDAPLDLDDRARTPSTSAGPRR